MVVGEAKMGSYMWRGFGCSRVGEELVLVWREAGVAEPGRGRRVVVASVQRHPRKTSLARQVVEWGQLQPADHLPCQGRPATAS